MRPRSVPECSLQRQEVGQRLARMLLIGQRVDHVQPRRGRRELLRARRCENVRITTASTQRSRLRATSATGSRWPSATSACSATTCAAQLADGDLERRSRPQRRLVEQHRDVAAVERVGGRRVAAERAVRLQLRGELEAALEIGGVEVEHATGSPCAASPASRLVACSHGAQVRYSALIRTYSALEIAGPHRGRRACPAPRSTATVDVRRPSGTPPPRARARRTAGRPRTARSGRSSPRRAIEHRTRRRRGRPPQSGVPSSDRRRESRSSRAASWRSPWPPAALRAAVAAPVTVTVTSLVAPSPPRTMPSASARQTARQRLDERRVAALVDRDAAGAVRQQHHAVVGRALAVDGDRVEGLVDRFAQRAVEQRAPAPPRRSSRSRASSPSSARSCRSPWPCRRP